MFPIYKLKNLLLIILWIFSIQNISADESKKIQLKWKESSAGTYSIQIKDEKDKLLYNTIIKEAKFEPELESGKYFYRIGSIKRNNIAYTKWIEIEVKISDIPEIVSPIEINEISTKAKRVSIKLEGKNLFKQSKLFFESKSDSLPVKIISAFKNELDIEIDTTNRKEEFYNLRIENPKDKKMLKNNYIQFSDPINRWEVVKRSLLFPGLGQIYRKDKAWHSYFYPISVVYFFGVFLRYNYLNQIYRENYTSTLNNAILFSTLTQNENINYLSLQYSYDSLLIQSEINDTNKLANQALTSIGIIYLFNLVDAFFFHKYSVGKKYDETKVQIYFSYLPQKQEQMNLNQNILFSLHWRF